MTAQVLCVMETHSSSSPYYPLESTIFSSGSDAETDKEYDSSESTFDLSFNSKSEVFEKQLPKKNDKYETHTLERKKSVSRKSEAINSRRNKNFRKGCVIWSIFMIKNVTVGVLSCAVQTTIGLLDFLIHFCTNKGVQNVLMVTFTVMVEVFVVMVFAVATILATVIINVDDAYRSRHESKFPQGRFKVRRRSERIEDGENTRSCRTRSVRRERSRRSSKSSKLNAHAPEYAGNVSETDLSTVRGGCSDYVPTDSLNLTLSEQPPSESLHNESTAENLNPQEVHISEKSVSELPTCGDTDADALQTDIDESLSQEPAICKQSTIYRNKILTIQDNETLLKKRVYHAAPKPVNTNKDLDTNDNKGDNKSQAEVLTEGAGNDENIKDKTDLSTSTSSPTNGYDVLENDSTSQLLSVTESSQCKDEHAAFKGVTPTSFVSTKMMFENKS